MTLSVRQDGGARRPTHPEEEGTDGPTELTAAALLSSELGVCRAPSLGLRSPPQCFGAGVPAGNRKGLGWLAVLLVPVACCAAPLLVVALSAAGAAAWGGLGAGAAAAVAVVLFVVVRRRRYAACGTSMCEPPTSGLAPGSTGGLGA